MKKLIFSILVCLALLGVFFAVKREEPLTEEKIQIDWAHESDSETVTLASREQTLPTDFVYDGERVTLNGPYFTGIPTDSTMSYRKRYAFENGLVGFEVILGKGANKCFLVDKTGTIVNFNHYTDNVVSDSAVISTYPEGLEIVQTGEPNAYEQQLFTTGGRALSEKFDSIGFFYNGLALVTRDGRVGIIDSDGKTLLSPCIAYDDLRYPPDNKGFWVRYMCEDAFVLPIDSEFAVFTLTRGETVDKGIKPLDKNSAKELVRAYLPSAYEVCQQVLCGRYETEMSPTELDGKPYYRIVEEGVKSLDDLRSRLLGYYTEECAGRILDSAVKNGPEYLEYGGALYERGRIESAYFFDGYLEGVSILEADCGSVLLEADYGFTSLMLSLKSNGKDWRFDTTPQESEYGRDIQPYEEMNIIRRGNGYLYLEDFVHSSPLSDEYTEDEVRRIFEPLMQRAVHIYENIRNSPFWSKSEVSFVEGKNDYYPLASAEVKGLEDIWQMAYGAYTKNAATRLFENEIGSGNDDCRYIERDGKIYYHNSGHGRDFTYLYNTVKTVYQYESVIVLTVSRLLRDEVEENIVFVMQKTPLGWRLENSENEGFGYKFFKAETGSYEKHSIPLPTENIARKYTPDPLVDLETFEWGEYYPMVCYATERYSRHDNIDAFAVLGEGIYSLEQGHAVWREFNEKYLVSYPRLDIEWQGKSVLENDALAEYLFESKITYIYPEDDMLGRTRFAVNDEGWHTEYDILTESGEVKETRVSLYPSDTPGGYYTLERDGGLEYITPFEEWEKYNITDRDALRIYSSDGKNPSYVTYRIYSVKYCQLLYEIELERKVDGNGNLLEGYYPRAVIDERYLLLAYSRALDSYLYQCVYLYDMEKDRLVFLEDYAEDVVLSLDLKYMMYRSPDYDGSFGDSGWDKAVEGIYIKNLESDETVLYRYDRPDNVTGFVLDCVCWSSLLT
ncbi:MAG: WG repeat-containing protein [Clostridia bacterium]|nr:WG repeat-containing protein [Clostridia bacterium]